MHIVSYQCQMLNVCLLKLENSYIADQVSCSFLFLLEGFIFSVWLAAYPKMEVTISIKCNEWHCCLIPRNVFTTVKKAREEKYFGTQFDQCFELSYTVCLILAVCLVTVNKTLCILKGNNNH